MKKFITVLALIVVASSCKKDNVKVASCYKCTFDAAPGYNQKPDETICTGEAFGQFTDEAGNIVTAHCNKIP